MLLTEERPHAFREYRVAGVAAATVAAGAVAAARGLRSRDVGCTGWAVHLSHERIATYARWRTTEDFLAAFTATQVDGTDGVNQAVAAMTRGLLSTDHHTYELVDSDEGAR